MLQVPCRPQDTWQAGSSAHAGVAHVVSAATALQKQRWRLQHVGMEIAVKCCTSSAPSSAHEVHACPGPGSHA